MNSKKFDKIRFGVNYTPSRKWWYSWNDFEKDEIARDLEAISRMGADHIRIMMIWPAFHPNRRWVSPAHLDRLDLLMTLAKEQGIDVCITMLTGWLSGWSFRPVFDEPQAFYTSAKMHEPVELYFKTVAERANRHTNFLGFDLGNEMNCCWHTSNLQDGDLWNRHMLDLCNKISPQATHVNGVDHQPWFYPETFSPAELAQSQELVALHCWISFAGALERGKWNERACTHLAPAMAALARAYAKSPTKPVWLQEFGASTSWLEAETIPIFLEKAVHAAIAGGICWITWWSSHEIRREYEFDPLEYDLGLIDVDNHLKPSGRAFQKLAKEFAGKPVVIPSHLPTHLPEHNKEATWAWIQDIQKVLP